MTRIRVGTRAGLGAGVALAVLAATATTALAAPPDAVRVGGPSQPADAKVAIVLGSVPLAGRPFEVREGRRTVLRGTLTEAPGDPSPWAHAARADLSRVREPGRYVVRVGDLASPPWTVERDAARRLLQRALRVFELNADGRERNPVFGPSHLNDARAPIVGGPTAGQTIDVEGGWRDAGDAIKFTTTIAMASVMLEQSARLDRAGADRLRRLSDVGIRWLRKAHPAGSPTFIGQVADSCEHALGFRDFATDDTNPNPNASARKAWGQAGSGTSGAAAAALALAAGRESGDRRRALLRLAREWYANGEAVAGPGPLLGQPGCEFPQAGDAASLGFGTDWQGFMALAAASLHGVTGERDFLDDAQRLLSDPAIEPAFGVHSYYFVAPLAGAELCGVLGRRAPAHPVRGVACSVLDEMAEAKAAGAAQTPFTSPGEYYFGWVTSMANAALWAAAQDAGLLAGGRGLAAEARDHLLGRNPWGASFVTGPEPHAARHPYHATFLKGDPVRLADGLVVGGPAARFQFEQFGLLDRLNPNDRFRPFNPTYGFMGDEEVIYEDLYGPDGRPYNYINGETGLAYSSPVVLLQALLGSRPDAD